MKTITKTVAGIMALALTLGIAGCSSGNSSDIYYAVCYDDSSIQSMYGIYVQGNNLLFVRAHAPEKSDLKPYENIIKDMGLRSPLSA